MFMKLSPAEIPSTLLPSYITNRLICYVPISIIQLSNIHSAKARLLHLKDDVKACGKCYVSIRKLCGFAYPIVKSLV